MKNKTVLFRKNITGNLLYWSSQIVDTNTIEINFGLAKSLIEDSGCKNITRILKTNKSDIENKRIIREKLKEGYKVANIDFDITKEDFHLTSEEIKRISNILGEIVTDINNSPKPMKCKVFQEGTLKYPVAGQPKINGVRCLTRIELVEPDLFTVLDKTTVARSKNGMIYVLPHITDNIHPSKLIDNDIELILDGEIYIPHKKLNVIRKHIPYINKQGTISEPEEDPKETKYFIFDLAIPDILQISRLNLLRGKFDTPKLENLMDTTKDIVIVPFQIINNDIEAKEYRDYCISLGFEGAVFRTLDKEYSFGHRPSFIQKYKAWYDGEFIVIDIIPKEKETETALFICKNDINNELFECNPEGTFEQRKEYLDNKNKYIGRMATIKYYERSGIKNVPFHANLITIRDEFDYD